MSVCLSTRIVCVLCNTTQHTTDSTQRIVFLSPLSTLLCVPILSGTAIYPCMHHTTTCRCRSCRRRTRCTSCLLTPCTPLQGHSRQHTFCIHCRQDDCPCPKMIPHHPRSRCIECPPLTSPRRSYLSPRRMYRAFCRTETPLWQTTEHRCKRSSLRRHDPWMACILSPPSASQSRD